MSKKEKKRRKKLAKCQERSDRRTAEFVMRRFDKIQTDLADLIPDLQSFEHWCEISHLTFCIRLIKEIRKKYKKVADGHTWNEDD